MINRLNRSVQLSLEKHDERPVVYLWKNVRHLDDLLQVGAAARDVGTERLRTLLRVVREQVRDVREVGDELD